MMDVVRVLEVETRFPSIFCSTMLITWGFGTVDLDVEAGAELMVDISMKVRPSISL